MNELKLPKSAFADRFIPKTKLYEKTKISYALQKEFSDKIQKITLKYKLAEETIGVSKTDKVVEIFIFEIELKERVIPTNLLKVIDKAIPYQILYHFVYKDSICWGTSLKYGDKIESYYFGAWNEEIQFDFSGSNLEILYQNLLKVFIRKEAKTSDNFQEMIAKDSKIKNLENEILVLENKIKAEKQLNRKVEVNKILLKKKNELKETKEASNEKAKNAHT